MCVAGGLWCHARRAGASTQTFSAGVHTVARTQQKMQAPIAPPLAVRQAERRTGRPPGTPPSGLGPVVIGDSSGVRVPAQHFCPGQR